MTYVETDTLSPSLVAVSSVIECQVYFNDQCVVQVTQSVHCVCLCVFRQ